MTPACCCSEWIGDLARRHTRRLAAVARREGLGGDDALDAVQDGFRTLLARADADALRDAPTEAARLLTAIVKTAQLSGCLAGLSEVHRQVVALRVLEELSGADAARALGLTPGHVAVLLHRARAQLERCMTDAP